FLSSPSLRMFAAVASYASACGKRKLRAYPGLTDTVSPRWPSPRTSSARITFMLTRHFLAAMAKIPVPVVETQEPHADVDRKVERQAVETDAENPGSEPLPGEVADDREAGQEKQGREREERVPGDLPDLGRGEDGPRARRHEERDDGRRHRQGLEPARLGR